MQNGRTNTQGHPGKLLIQIRGTTGGGGSLQIVYLLLKYQCHINVEVRGSLAAKYLFKYLFKGEFENVFLYVLKVLCALFNFA